MKEQTGPVATLIQPKLPRVKFFERTPGERYQPCNGTEGEFFHSMWCEECARDKLMNGECTQEEADRDPDGCYCMVLNLSFQDGGVPEWVIGEDGQPMCTAFVPKGQPIPNRCEHTPDMFGGAATDVAIEPRR